jgi:hypothetical protein
MLPFRVIIFRQQLCACYPIIEKTDLEMSCHPGESGILQSFPLSSHRKLEVFA